MGRFGPLEAWPVIALDPGMTAGPTVSHFSAHEETRRPSARMNKPHDEKRSRQAAPSPRDDGGGEVGDLVKPLCREAAVEERQAADHRTSREVSQPMDEPREGLEAKRHGEGRCHHDELTQENPLDGREARKSSKPGLDHPGSRVPQRSCHEGALSIRSFACPGNLGPRSIAVKAPVERHLLDAPIGVDERAAVHRDSSRRAR